MNKKRFEDYKDINKLIKVCLSKSEGICNRSWVEIAQEFDNEFKPEALARFGKYISIYKRSLDIEEDNESELLEIRKEKKKLSDQRRELNRNITELARMEQLFETFERHLKERKRVEIKNAKPTKKGRNKREILIYISDVHYGVKVDNELNKYNPEIAKDSFNQLLKDTKELTKLYKVNKAIVLLGGDIVSGIIHTNLRLQQTEDVISQVLGVADLIEDFCMKLKATGVKIEVVGTIGNHSRIMADKKQSLNSENFERIVFKQLEKAGFKVLQESDTAVFEVAKNTVVALHGHQTSPAKAFEYCVKRKKVIPKTILIAHFHSDTRLDNGCNVIINGSMVGVDEYALEKGYNSQPHQKIMIFEEGKGEICTFKTIFDNRV